jgi:type IV secretory pathway VirB2 component (pilin)
MKKIIITLALLFLTLQLITPVLVLAASEGIVPCNPTCDAKGCTGSCKLDDFFTMLNKIYEFVTTKIAIPLAVIGVTVGGILMLISAGNPNMFGMGKKTLYISIIGLVLVLCSYMIVKFILNALGANVSF